MMLEGFEGGGWISRQRVEGGQTVEVAVKLWSNT
jgi:hypothetical protein